MPRLILDTAMCDKLRANGNVVELCDEKGQVLGFFYRTPQAGKIRSPFTYEDIQRFRQEKGGRSLAEILKDLGAT